MKRTIMLVMILCGFSIMYSQDMQGLIEEIKKMALENDSLKRELESNSTKYKQQILNYQVDANNLNDTINSLKSELSELSKFKDDKKYIEAQLKSKSDSIIIVQNLLQDIEIQTAKLKVQSEEKLRKEKENNKKEALKYLIDRYKNESFDELIKISSLKSIKRDKELIGNSEVDQILNDIEYYFIAKDLFENKFNIEKVRSCKNQLRQLKYSSELLDKLKEDLDNFELFNDGLREMLKRIDDIDDKEMVDGMGKEIEELKFNKILAELTTYIFMYDFNFIDYPYLSEIVLEVINLKKPNVDSDIKHLIKKL